jgi:hypothetical protein
MDKFNKVNRATSTKFRNLIRLGEVGIIVIAAFGLFILAGIHGEVLQRYAGSDYAAVIAAVLVDQTNDERATDDLPPLEPNILLTVSAQLKANDMADQSYFAHVSPSGLSPWHWFEQAGYRFSYAGENLAVNFRDSGSVTRAWMNSPTHRDNIINNNYSQIGIATATGQYKNQRSTYVAQHFGTPYGPQRDYSELESLLGRPVTAAEKSQAIADAENLIAAVGQVGVVDKLMVQPDRIYGTLFLLLMIVVLALSFRSYLRCQTRTNQRQILLQSALAVAILIILFAATMFLLDTEVVAGGIN